MKTNNHPTFAVEIKRKYLEKILPSYQILKNILNQHNVNFSLFALIINNIHANYDINNIDEYLDSTHKEFNNIKRKSLKEIIQAYISFRQEFHDKYGLFIYCRYHNGNGPSAFFELDFGEIYKLSDKAKNLQHDIPFEISQFI